MRPAPRRVARAAQRAAQRRQPLVEQLDAELGQGGRLLPDRRHAGLGGESDALLDGGQGQDPGRAGEPRADTRLGIVGGTHREHVVLAEPALDGVAQRALMLAPDVQERGRAWSRRCRYLYVQPTARSAPQPSRSIGTAPTAWLRSHSIERARSVGGAGDRRHVGESGRSVVDERQDDQGDVLVERARHIGGRGSRRPDRSRSSAAPCRAARARPSRTYRSVGNSSARGDDVAPACAARERGIGELVEIDRRRIADRDLARPWRRRARRRSGRRRAAASSIQWSQPRTSSRPHSSPTTRASRSAVCFRQPAERVPVEVDESGSSSTKRARKRAQWVVVVKRGGTRHGPFGRLGERARDARLRCHDEHCRRRAVPLHVRIGDRGSSRQDVRPDQ